MRLATIPPTCWLVTLRDGAVVEVWAHVATGLSGGEDQRDFEFGYLVDFEATEDASTGQFSTLDLPVRDGTIATVARFPRASVVDVNSA
jgi:hypothetical protein